MTVASTTQRIRYTGNGATVTFAIPFAYDSASEVEVTLRDETTPTAITETAQTNPAHYSISGSNVVMVTAPSSTQKLMIRRIVALTQAIDFITNGVFPAQDNETGLDHIVYALQQLNEYIGRAPKFIKTSPTSGIDFPEPLADALVSWNTAGTNLENKTAAAIFAMLLPWTITNSRSSPGAITAVAGITSSSGVLRQLKFIQGSGGPVDISASPQITAGTIAGQEMLLICCSNTNTVKFDNGNGLDLNGSITMGDGDALYLVWDGTNWQEVSRR